MQQRNAKAKKCKKEMQKLRNAKKTNATAKKCKQRNAEAKTCKKEMQKLINAKKKCKS